jgi:hypothetical protein
MQINILPSQDNSHPIQQTICNCHLAHAPTKDHERNRPYHPEETRVTDACNTNNTLSVTWTIKLG